MNYGAIYVSWCESRVHRLWRDLRIMVRITRTQIMAHLRVYELRVYELRVYESWCELSVYELWHVRCAKLTKVHYYSPGSTLAIGQAGAREWCIETGKLRSTALATVSAIGQAGVPELCMESTP